MRKYFGTDVRCHGLSAQRNTIILTISQGHTKFFLQTIFPKLYIDAGVYTIEDIREKTAYTKEIEKQSRGEDSEIQILEESVDDRFVESMKKFYEINIKTYTDKLGNVEYVNIPGDHSIFKHKPDEAAKAVGEFISGLEPHNAFVYHAVLMIKSSIFCIYPLLSHIKAQSRNRFHCIEAFFPRRLPQQAR